MMTLKNIKTIEELKSLMNDNTLVMFSFLDPHSKLDMRDKSNAHTSEHLIVLKFVNDKLCYYSTLTSKLNHFSDVEKMVYERFQEYKPSIFSNKEDGLFELFLYNAKKGNKMFITPSLFPAELKAELEIKMRSANQLLSLAKKLCFEKSTKTYSHEDTIDKKGRYNKISDNAVAIRESYPSYFIKYKIGEEAFSFDFTNSLFKISKEEQYSFEYRGTTLRRACTSNYNTKYNILTITQKNLQEIHGKLQEAVEFHKNVHSQAISFIKTV